MVHDPYYDLVPEPVEPPFDPQRTALLTIDLQYLDAHPDGWMGRLARDQGKSEIVQERWDNIERILPNVRRLQDACRAKGVEVIFLRGVSGVLTTVTWIQSVSLSVGRGFRADPR